VQEYIAWYEELNLSDTGRVGGKNASLGEMIAKLSGAGIAVPRGFATTDRAYCEFVSQGGLEERINTTLRALDVNDVIALAEAGAKIRQWLMAASLTPAVCAAITVAYREMERAFNAGIAVAVRSSATAEDLPQASFAGQQETYLNVRGLEGVLAAVKKVFVSLFNDRAIAYRVHRGYDDHRIAMSAGVQHMVRSDIGASGVLFTLDTESGFRDVVFISASYGLGEAIVQGVVNPDEFYVYKPNLRAGKKAVLRRTLGAKATKMILGEDEPTRSVAVPQAERQRFCVTDLELETLARHALTIEDHYGRPMDVEWGKDGVSGHLYILQARPETVKSQEQVIERFHLRARSAVLVAGRSVGERIGAGRARVILDLRQMDRLQDGEVLVTDMTDPDWEPVMKRAAAIVTNRGGRTCHAAIIARELGIPAVVGAERATSVVQDGQEVTVSCAEGDTGYVYTGILPFHLQRVKLDSMPEIPVRIMMNVGNPDRAFALASLPNQGVGLARLEFIINRLIGIHPRAVLAFESMPETLQAEIRERSAGYPDPLGFYLDKLAEGIATLAAAFAPKPVIVRLSDFKSNEYANLLGGEQFEPREENPMLGFRGAARYLAPAFRECFELECRALRKVREELGFTNVEVMVPFVRTLEEAEGVAQLLEQNGLKRGEHGLHVIMMCELPSNALLADEFLRFFDGFSIGSNDLTQLTLGLDRDSALLAARFDERDPAVKALVRLAIRACKAAGKYIGLCGQGPSDHPDFANWLVAEGVESISLNPDTVLDTWLYLAEQGKSG